MIRALVFWTFLVLIAAGCGQGLGKAMTFEDASESPDDAPSVDVPIGEELPLRWGALWSDEAPQDPEREEWSKHLWRSLLTLGSSMKDVVPYDAIDYCPNFEQLEDLERLGLYHSLISAMAKYESGFDPSTTYQESFKDSQGRWVISRGLLQLSVESANGYGCKVIESDLHVPKLNLACGVRILARWLKRDGAIGSSPFVDGSRVHRGGARYWAVLRETSSSRAKIQGYTRSQPLCRTVDTL